MNHDDSCINLISFGRETIKKDVYNALVELGNSVTTLNQRHWLEGNCTKNSYLFVLVLGNQDSEGARINLPVQLAAGNR